MSRVALCSLRSCGVTTAALGLTTAWATTRAVVLAELDPHGGTLAARLGLAGEPGLVSLAAAARRRSDPEVVIEHTQDLTHGGQILVGPPTGAQARAALTAASGVIERLDVLDADVVADCGRVGDLGAWVSSVGWADRVVVMCRPDLPDLHALASSLETWSSRSGYLELVLVGKGPYPAGEITDALGLAVAGQIPFDPDGAALFATRGVPAKALWRTPFGRAIRSLADQLGASDAPVLHLTAGEAESPNTVSPNTERPGETLDEVAAPDDTGAVPAALVDDAHSRLAFDAVRVAR